MNDPVTAQNEFETYKTLTGEEKPVTGWIAELRARNKAGAPPHPGSGTGSRGAGSDPAPRRLTMTKLLLCAMLLLSMAAVAQTPNGAAPPPARPNDTMEPGVNTSTPAQSPGRTSAPASNAAARPASPGTPAANKPATGAPAAAAASAKKGNAKDRLDLDSSQITGNRELPKVLYIVPWRSAELGDLVGRPVNSLLDEVLEPVDRDVFRRQNRYYEALQPNEATPASKPEK